MDTIEERPPGSDALPAGRVWRLASANVPPLLFLIALTTRYALVAPACASSGGRIALEATVALTLGAVAAIALLLRRTLARGETSGAPATARAETDRFLATLGLLAAVLFLLATVALWLPSLFLGACPDGR